MRKSLEVIADKFCQFPMKANAVIREPEIAKRCTDGIYEWQASRTDAESYILHDGPPYANGEPHTGE